MQILCTAIVLCSFVSGISAPKGEGKVIGGNKLSGSRPNIIMVLTDDQGYADMACNGNPDLITPNLDKLHKQSTRLDQFYGAPTCAPSRAQLMTGNNEVYGGITHTILERDFLTLDAVLLPETLKKSGYTTGMFGKWHLGDKKPYRPYQRGFNEVLQHGAGGISQFFPMTCADSPGNNNNRLTLLHNEKFVKPKGYCTDVYFDYMMKWAGNKAKENVTIQVS